MRPSLNLLFWVSLAISGIVYAVMLTWTLPSISAAAGGRVPFDLRPLGYSPDEATAFLQAITDDGRELYLNVQHRLDIVYPLSLALVIASGIAILAPVQRSVWKWALASVALPGMLFDFWENRLVRKMLLANPENIDPQLISAASFATLMKSVFSTIALSTLFLLLLSWAYGRWKMTGRSS